MNPAPFCGSCVKFPEEPGNKVIDLEVRICGLGSPFEPMRGVGRLE